MATIKFTKCREGVKEPVQASGSVGLDIYACFEEDYMKFLPGETKLVPTGLKSVIDPQYFVLLEERSSTGSKGIKRSAGVIDPDYRGEWFIAITNVNPYVMYITKLDPLTTRKQDEPSFNENTTEDHRIYYPYEKAIIQAIILPKVDLDLEFITEEEFSEETTERGEGRLGSSGH